MIRLRESRATEPAQLVVGLQEAKAYLKVADSDISDDPIIAGLLGSAERECELHTGRALLTQTWTGFLDFWPLSDEPEYWEGYRVGSSDLLTGGPRFIEFRRSPIQSITSIKTYDDSDTATVYASSNYMLDSAQAPNRLVLRTGASAPVTTRAANGIEIIYVAGYGDNPGDVPQNLRDGILRFAAHAYEHRGDMLTEDALRAASGAAMLWDREKVMRI